MTLKTIAKKYGFSLAAAEAVRDALRTGHGSMAQFNHPELGGSGQWMKSGMLMIGDMFNDALQGRVSGFINEIAASPKLWETAASPWWPKEFGTPSMTSGQNDIRYAYFPAVSRLVIEMDHVVAIYSTDGLTVHGISQQQQSNARQLAVNTSSGSIPLDKLHRV